MSANKRIGVVERKKVKWLLAPSPGPHKKSECVSSGVFLRDVVCRAATIREAKKILNTGGLLADGKKIKDIKFPLGLMDIVSEPAQKKTYRISLSGPNLIPREITGDNASRKYLRVAKKHVVKGGKTNITFHDGRNYLGDNQIKTGDTCVFSIPGFKMEKHIKLEPGARCLVVEGKHRGEIAKLEKIIERPGSHDSEALLKDAESEFITVVKYLFVVDDQFA